MTWSRWCLLPLTALALRAGAGSAQEPDLDLSYVDDLVQQVLGDNCNDLAPFAVGLQRQ